MPEEYKLAYRGGTGEIVEKKSRFIADVMPVSSEDEAQAFIADIKNEILGCQTSLLCICDR